MPIPYINKTDDELFDYLNFVLIGWIVLAVFPRWKYSVPIAKFVGLIYAVLYVVLMYDSIAIHPIDLGPKYPTIVDAFASLDGIHKMFSYKSAVFGGWVHYVVFDLWTGIYIVSDAKASGIVTNIFNQLILLPILFFTMMLGPTGLLLYSIIKAIHQAIFSTSNKIKSK
jgi:hypothetical protein